MTPSSYLERRMKMYTKRMSYKDYNGVQRTEDFRFNFTQAELVELEMTVSGGIEAMIQGIIDAQDRAELIRIFKKLILDSYGVKSPDGKRFIKNEELKEEFSQTEAYSDLFILLSSNDKEAAKFINGIMPEDMPKIEIDPNTKEAKIIEGTTATNNIVENVFNANHQDEEGIPKE